ncbi:MAG TPA: glucose/galactose MFS transporter, partial [Chryseosolibacter sp.]|nr:glucose/galactose MFS transporter [Chryseosolibacter sp.]
TSYTLWSMVVGYTIGILLIPKYLKQETALKISAVVGILFTILAYTTTGYTSILFIALMGFANSLMWPAIFPMAIDGLGRFTKIGSALLIMGIAGGAVIPQIYGLLVHPENLGLNSQTAFFAVVLPCYLYILYYATKGYRAGRV